MDQNFSHYLTVRRLMLEIFALHVIYFQEATLLVNSHSWACGETKAVPFFSKLGYVVLVFLNSTDCL